jgi:zinc transporter ZupT
MSTMKAAFLYAMQGLVGIGSVLVAMSRFQACRRPNLPWAFSFVSTVMLVLTGLDFPVKYFLLSPHFGLSYSVSRSSCSMGHAASFAMPSPPDSIDRR